MHTLINKRQTSAIQRKVTVLSAFYTLGVYGVGCPATWAGRLVLPDDSKAVPEGPPYLRNATTPKNGDRQHFRANRK